MDEQADIQMDELMVSNAFRNEYCNNDMLMVICVKFHHVGTLASLKSNLIKNFNLSGTGGRMEQLTDWKSICPS